MPNTGGAIPLPKAEWIQTRFAREQEEEYRTFYRGEWTQQTLVVSGLLALMTIFGSVADYVGGMPVDRIALKAVLCAASYCIVLACCALPALQRFREASVTLMAMSVIAGMIAVIAGSDGMQQLKLFEASLTVAFMLAVVLPFDMRQMLGFVGACTLASVASSTVFLSPAFLAANLDIVGVSIAINVAVLIYTHKRDTNHRRAFLAFSRQSALVAEQQALVRELTHLVHTDPLTGVGNRRSFEIRLNSVWHAALARGSRMAVLLVDIDHFKLLNDSAGHAFGDRCLRAVAQAIVAGAGCTTDVVARYGGEEFVLVVEAHDCDDVGVWAESIREGVKDLGIANPGGGKALTVSIGVATARPAQGRTTAPALFEAADAALYQAKRNGRDRVEHSLWPVRDAA